MGCGGKRRHGVTNCNLSSCNLIDGCYGWKQPDIAYIKIGKGYTLNAENGSSRTDRVSGIMLFKRIGIFSGIT